MWVISEHPDEADPTSRIDWLVRIGAGASNLDLARFRRTRARSRTVHRALGSSRDRALSQIRPTGASTCARTGERQGPMMRTPPGPRPGRRRGRLARAARGDQGRHHDDGQDCLEVIAFTPVAIGPGGGRFIHHPRPPAPLCREPYEREARENRKPSLIPRSPPRCGPRRASLASGEALPVDGQLAERRTNRCT